MSQGIVNVAPWGRRKSRPAVDRSGYEIVLRDGKPLSVWGGREFPALMAEVHFWQQREDLRSQLTPAAVDAFLDGAGTPVMRELLLAFCEDALERCVELDGARRALPPEELEEDDFRPGAVINHVRAKEGLPPLTYGDGTAEED